MTTKSSPYLHGKNLSCFDTVEEAIAGVLWDVAMNGGSSSGWQFSREYPGPAPEAIELLRLYKVYWEPDGTFALQ